MTSEYTTNRTGSWLSADLSRREAKTRQNSENCHKPTNYDAASESVSLIRIIWWGAETAPKVIASKKPRRVKNECHQ